MKEIIIRCRKVYPGHVKGEALVSKMALGTWKIIDEKTGDVHAVGSDLCGKSIKDKVLLFPCGKGSSGWGHNFQCLGHNGAAPKAMLVGLIDARVALGAISAKVPSVTDFEIDPWTVIEDGDWVDVDADAGIVTVTKKECN